MSVVNNNLLLTADAAASSYQVQRSLRFNSADSAYLNRTPSVAGNQKTWTWAGWVKRSSFSAFHHLIRVNAGVETAIRFDNITANCLQVYAFTSVFVLHLRTSAIFRDPAAWFHIVVAVDTTQATASDRVKIYVNGAQQTSFSTEIYPTQNLDTGFNQAALHAIGAAPNPTEYFNGLLAECYLIDGQALTPSSFTETNATTGQLVPKAFGGSYGVNGFRLNFSDNSAATAATLGADSSGNGNNWTPNNLSVSTGGPSPIATSTGGLPIYNTTDTYGAVKGTGTRTDSNAANLVLAIPMDGANNGTTFTDESATIRGSGTAKAITPTSAITSTAQSKFYGSSGFFNGATSTRLTLASSADFAFGTGAYTIEAWIYPTAYASAQGSIFDSGNANGAFDFFLTSTGALGIGIYGTGNTFVTSASAVSLSQWTHVSITRTSTSASSARIYVNGVLASTGTDSSNWTVNTTPSVGGINIAGYSFSGYIQDLRVYKGVAKYTSNFTPPSATQNTTVAAGNDSLTDTPTSYGTDTGAGGEVRGNYATLNPLEVPVRGTTANGNLEYTSTGSNTGLEHRTATIRKLSSGKWYFECNVTGLSGSADPYIGWVNNNFVINVTNPDGSSNSWAIAGGVSTNNCVIRNGATNTVVFTGAPPYLLMIAIDIDAGKIWFGKNGTWAQSGNPATATNPQFTNLANGPYSPLFRGTGGIGGTSTLIANFGQRPFAYAAPSDFKALCDTNLPTPTIAKGSSVFDTTLYTGTGAALTATSSLAFSPDLVWIKGRSGATDHAWYDTVRGATLDLVSNSTAAETTQTQGLTAFNSNGFTVGTLAKLNTSAATYAGWCWDAGSLTVTNTDGSISSQVRANPSAGFSVVTYTGNGTNATVGHGLGVAPNLIINKRQDTTANWQVRHVSIPPANRILLNLTDASINAPTIWNSTAPSSTVFSIGTLLSVSTAPYVNYCFAPVTGYSSFGSYTGNGSADGSFVYLSFRPAFLMLKRTNSTGNWVMLDSKREGYNVDNNPLYTNLASVEGTADLVDITSNGFKLRSTITDINASGSTYIYAAYAENPFQYARAR